MLAPDVRLEGFTAEDWTRITRLFRPSAAPKTPSLGGVVVIHEGGRVRKMLHTQRGRLEPEGEWRDWADEPEPTHVKRLAALAEAQHASWVVAAEAGAFSEVMERFGARARRGDDIVAQALSLVGIVRELMNEGRIDGWPRRLKNVPIPTEPMVKRAVDALCKEGHAIALGVFDRGELWTALVARRGPRGFDLIGGPDELRAPMGLLSGDWRRDWRHLASAVEHRYAPLSFGCFGERRVLEALQADERPGAWSRAAAVRDVVLSPMPLAIGLAIGVDGARYAFDTLRSIAPAEPLGLLEPALRSLRKRALGATEKDIASVLGFSPLELLRALRRKQ